MGADVHRLRPQGRAVTAEARPHGRGRPHQARSRDRIAPLVTLEDIRRAAANLAGVAMRTPLVPFGTVPGGTARVLLKAESLQPIGAFKIRGAYHAIASLSAGSVRAASSPTRRATMPRASRARRGCSERGPSSSCRRTRRRSSAGGSRRMAPRSSRWVRPATSASRDGRSELAAEQRPRSSSRRTTTTGSSRARAPSGSRSPRTCRISPPCSIPIGGGGLASGVAVAIRALHPGRGSSASSRSLRRTRGTRCARAASCAGTRTRSAARSPTAHAARRSVGGRSRTCRG